MEVTIIKDTTSGEMFNLGECGFLWISFGGEVIGISAENILRSIKAKEVKNTYTNDDKT